MKSPIQRSLFFSLLFLSFTITNCGKSSSTAADDAAVDTSASAAAAGAVGGALSNSSSSGTQARLMSFSVPQTRYASLRSEMSLLPNAMAELFCPTFKTQGSGCNVSGDEMWLSYDNCTFFGRASWNGSLA